MSDFMPGDIIVGPATTRLWKYIGEVDRVAYLVPLDHKDGELADAVAFFGTEGWRLAPKPFFEEKRTYESLNNNKVTIWHVHEMTRGRVAVGQWTEGDSVLLKERDFENFTEI